MRNFYRGCLSLYFVLSVHPYLFSQITIKRGPYLQKGTASSITIHWKTNNASDAKLYYGTDSTQLTNVIFQPGLTDDHVISITGLAPYTTYYYKVGNSAGTIAQSPKFSFRTSPLTGTKGNYRFWVIGDSGSGNADQQSVRDAYLQYTNSVPADGWLMLGDNAYNSGFDSEYQNAVFQNMYEDILSNTVLWPAPGNHDYNNHIPFSPSPAYYDIFDLPSGGECGGVPSGTEKYYSWNYGNIHFISLDSYDESRSTTGAMATWLQADLSANTLPWVIAYWHHPPYTKGSHNSDNSNFLDGELVEIRENIIPVLESYGVDLILNGHSHSYERSMLIDGHYGYSSSFNNNMVVDSGSGNYNTTCPYIKNPDTNPAHQGTVYAVVGCSGKLSSVASDWPHPVMYHADANHLGSMILDVNDNRLDAVFLDNSMQIQDRFTIVKHVGEKIIQRGCAGDQFVLKPSWKPEGINWYPGNQQSDSLVVNLSLPTYYLVSDHSGCITDTLALELYAPDSCSTATGIFESEEGAAMKIYPNIINGSGIINVVMPADRQEKYVFTIINAEGRMIRSFSVQSTAFSNIYQLQFELLSSGIYWLNVAGNEKAYNEKFIVTQK